MLAHDLVQQGFTALAVRWGSAGLAWREGLVAGAVGLVLGVAGWLGAYRRHGRRADVVWVLLGGAALGAWGVLGQTPAELVHFVQFGGLAWLVWRAGLPATPALLVAVGLGAGDEAWQAWVLYPTRAFDWNDVVLDTVGGMLGLGLRWSARGWTRAGFLVPGIDGARFHPLGAAEGLGTLALLVGLFHLALGREDTGGR